MEKKFYDFESKFIGVYRLFEGCDFDYPLLRIFSMRFLVILFLFIITSCVKDDKCYDLVAGETYEVPCESQE